MLCALCAIRWVRRAWKDLQCLAEFHTPRNNWMGSVNIIDEDPRKDTPNSVHGSLSSAGASLP